LLKTMLKENIQISNSIENWEEAIHLASMPLLEKNNIQKKYVDAMIDGIKELGPYIILIPGVAMPHSRPENGVNDTSMALLKIEEGVSFSPTKEDVKLVFILAAKDNSSHMDALVGLSDLLEDEKKVDAIIRSVSVEEILNIL